MRRPLAVIVLLLFAGCATYAIRNFDSRYGAARPKEEVAATGATVEYERDIRPLMEGRCLVCHGCYDAPCQLKLDSYEGVLRGASKVRVYHSSRLVPDAPSRLFEDAQTTADWRTRGFFPVLNERRDSPEVNLRAGVMAQMLDLKEKQPLPADKLLPDTFDLSLERNQQCPRIEEFDGFAKKFPLWGMPYGFPALDPAQHKKFTDWLALGAPVGKQQSFDAALAQQVDEWEAFFNGESLKQQLAARYLYEHLFLAHLYFEDAGARTVFFKIVRSRTPPGEPLDMIATRRPYDDPGVARVYYRLWRDPASIVAKTHMPYSLTPARRQRWRKWFIDADYKVTQLPGYDAKTASNPFLTFDAIPARARHSFLLDEAQFTIMNFIKGPVCRGNVALDVIQNRFWVFFTPPQSAAPEQFSKFLASQGENLRLPAEVESGLWSIAHWRRFAKSQSTYLRAKTDFIRANLKAYERAGLNTFWDGGGTNPNAVLTVFRHNDSASVLQGLIGEPPMTAWLIDYPMLERIHYLLVAGFDVYGTASHQAITRMYMDFLRMEGEMNFLAFLPQEQRKAEVARWYRGATDSVQEYLDAYFEHEVLPTPVPYKTDQPKLELFNLLYAREANVLNHAHDLERSGLSRTSIAELSKLSQVQGVPASLLPQVVLVKIKGHGLLTITSDSAYTNLSSMFGEADRRFVAEDRLTVANGVIGAYPNVFLELDESAIPELVKSIGELASEEDYGRLLDRFGVRRTDPRFWALSDSVLADYKRAEPLASGVLDYSRYENR